MHLDKRLTWCKHIFTKRKQLGLKFRQMYWLLGRDSSLALDNKLVLYKTILKPIWTYRIALWRTASISKMEILQRFQNRMLRVLVNARWYVPNGLIHSDLNVPAVREVITKLSVRYCGTLQAHPNHLANILLEDEEENRRLKRFKPSDVTTRFTYTTLIPCYCPVLALVCAQFKVATSVSCFVSVESIHCNISLHAFDCVHFRVTFMLCTYYPLLGRLYSYWR
jgi:hypothetical protein